MTMSFVTLPALAVEVEPVRLELTIPANQPTQGVLAISNPGSTAVEVRLSMGGYRFSQPGLNFPSCQDWLSFDPQTFTLAAGASTPVRYTITPPANLQVDTAGEYLAAIQVDQLPSQPGEPRGAVESRVTIIPRLALPVYLQIQGREVKKVEISDLSVSLREAQMTPEMATPPPDLIRIDVTLRNKGTVHARPSGTFALFGPEGELVRGGPLGRSVPILPAAELTLPSLQPLPPAGRYKLVLTVEPYPGEMLQKESRFEVTEDGEVVMETGE